MCRRLGGTKTAQYEQGILISFNGKGKENHHLGTGILYTKE
jgi:hypothetical protein